MAIQTNIQFSETELMFAIVLQDGYLFAMMFWPDEFSLPPSMEQRIMLTDISRKQLLCTARKVGKTLEIERDVLWALVMRYLSNSNELHEAIFLAPRLAHIEPTRDRIFSKASEPFFADMIKEKNKSSGGVGILESYNKFKWHFRIEGSSRTDENVVGIRARKIIEDECAFATREVYQSLIMTGFRDTSWKLCGVPNGIRSTIFYELDTRPSIEWSKHKYSTFINPLFDSAKAREDLIKLYGGVNTQGYKTQVLGEWGEEAFSSFPPGAIAVDNKLPITLRELTRKQILNNADSLSSLVPLPQFPNARYCIGLDYGYAPDPTEILIAYNQGETTWRQLARITLVTVELPIQARFLHWLISIPLANKVVRVSTDNIQFVQQMTDDEVYANKYKEVMHFANPGGTTVITDPTNIPILDANGKEIKKRNKQYYTDELKLVFYNTLLDTPYRFHLWLGKDDFLTEAVTGMTERKTEGGYVVYECAKAEEEHSKDALLYLLSAILSCTSGIVAEDWNELASVMGWVGPIESRGWTAPWSN